MVLTIDVCTSCEQTLASSPGLLFEREGLGTRLSEP